MELTLRPAREEDVPFLTAACSQAIAAGNGTRGTERVTNRRTFLAAHSGPPPSPVPGLADGEAAGGSPDPWKISERNRAPGGQYVLRALRVFPQRFRS